MYNPDSTTSTLAPICIINTPKCTADKMTDNCKITCMSIDNSKQIQLVWNNTQWSNLDHT